MKNNNRTGESALSLFFFFLSKYLVSKSGLGLIYFTKGDIVRENEW